MRQVSTLLLVVVALGAAAIAPRLSPAPERARTSASRGTGLRQISAVVLHTRRADEDWSIPLTGPALDDARACLPTMTRIDPDMVRQTLQDEWLGDEIWLVQVTDARDDRMFEVVTPHLLKGHRALWQSDCLWDRVIAPQR